MTSSSSPFAEIPPADWLAENRSAYAIADAHPVSAGHSLVVPRRLIATWWEASRDERHDLMDLVDEVKALLDERPEPDGYNVGFNAGVAAGQTVDHLHLHVIPRYHDDVADPRGGIRHVIPALGNYLDPGAAQAPTPIAGATAAASPELFDGVDRRLLLELKRCLINERFDRIDLLVSFVMKSGLAAIDSNLESALTRGAAVRVLTTDYLAVTDADALARLLDVAEWCAAADYVAGSLEVRVWHDPRVSFHPKAYLFRSSDGQLARGFVGSSNLSRSGIDGGVEWNLGVGQTSALIASFERLWSDERSQPLDHDFLRAYRDAWRPQAGQVVPIGVETEPPSQPVEPWPVQREALDDLEATRAEGFAAGLVVMATGLGKTWVAAFDTARPEFRRVLFIAHREEILRQTRDVFRQVRPDAELGLFYGEEKQPGADVVFASIQTLARRLHEFDPAEFDYVVIDEFHHAEAATYRQAIAYFQPRFLLGLTATPERMDGADLLALCGDNLVFDCDLVAGIRRGNLVPFDYWGIADVTDFAPIPWRNGRFDPEALTQAVETRERAQQALHEWRDRGGGRTLAFCCSISHADYMAEFLREQGVGAVAVHSGPSSAPRAESLDRLRTGELEVICSIDMFNEGVDLPQVDCVLMLRPTESPVIFLQQLGRGLRTAAGKERLAVIDFIGNHRSFLLKPRSLLSLGRRSTPTDAEVVRAVKAGEFDLPDGCSVHYELEAIDLLASLVKQRGGEALAEYCLSYEADVGRRPTALQAFRAGMNPRAARKGHGHWFGLLGDIQLLSDASQRVLDECGDTLAAVEREPITKAYKLVTLMALSHEGTLRSGTTVASTAAAARSLIQADPRLRADLDREGLAALDAEPPEPWQAFWRKWPLEHLANAKGGAALFRLAGDRFEPTYSVPDEVGDTFDSLVAELVEWRLADYLLGKTPASSGEIRCKVNHADGRPIVMTDHDRHPSLPTGEATFYANGDEYVGRFVKVALNVATRPGEQGNALHSLLRGWFGPAAGHAGTRHFVILGERDGRWIMRPDEATGVTREVIPLFPSLEVACGAFGAGGDPATASTTIEVSSSVVGDPTEHFVVFARGDSMDGGAHPIRHGDALLMEWVRNLDRQALVGSVVLVQLTTAAVTATALKVLERDGDGWQLTSTNPDTPPIAGTTDMTIVARLVRRLDQRDINPLADKIGELYKRSDIPALYGAEFSPGNWNSGHVSIPGHAILFVTLEKSEHMTHGADYVDHFEGPDTFVWSSQNSVGPDSKKGHEILDALSTGTQIHLWTRQKKTDVAFEYRGLVVPVSHSGDRPMSVRMRRA